MNFAKINTRFKDEPIVTGKDVFSTREYAEDCGLNLRTVRERLQVLEQEGAVRKVRTRRDGKVTSAWEYIPAKKRATSE